MRPALLRIAMISVHSSPLGPLGAQDTGGMSVYIRELSRELARLGHRVDIFTAAGAPMPGARTQRMHPYVRLIRLPLGTGRQAAKAEVPAHLARFADGMREFARRTGTGYDLIHSHYWLSGRVGEDVRTGWSLPHVLTFHTLGAMKNAVFGREAEPQVRIAAERALAEACDAIVVTSRREKNNLVALCRADPGRVRVAPCGVDVGRFRPLDAAAARRRLGALAGERIVLYVGRFAAEKGVDRLLRAFAQLGRDRPVRLAVVGGDADDPQVGRMRRLAGDLGIDGRVTFTGRVEHTELPHLYGAADVLAVPSSYESFGMVALEALACGTPVAATPVGAMDELIVPDRNGRVADAFTPEALALSLERVLALPHAGTELGREEIRRTVLRYEWPRVACEVLRVYRSVLPAPEELPEEPPAAAAQAGGAT